MVMCKVVVVDAKTGKQSIENRNLTLIPGEPPEEPVKTDDVKKVVAYAKSKGWI